ncbi:hypothetical protein J3Q64DRAFT_1753815 [Phycomyces blakesleeanus]|uniref:Homeodomain-like DNA binding domain-containing transcription factor n=1 Tax=Phycomyces blakesleeanus TaxID=4837 RepID=A0ABR3AT16_PHYBL
MSSEYALPGAYEHHHHHNHHNNQNWPIPVSLAISSVFCPTDGLLTQPVQDHHRFPGAWVDEEERADNLRQTIATLRKETKELEKTDLIVKKSIEIVAQKRVLAHTKQKRKQSQWDWCDRPEEVHAMSVTGHEWEWEWVQ